MESKPQQIISAMIISASSFIVGGAIVTVLWNFEAPFFWSGAPRMDLLHGMALLLAIRLIGKIIKK